MSEIAYERRFFDPQNIVLTILTVSFAIFIKFYRKHIKDPEYETLFQEEQVCILEALTKFRV